MSECLETQLMSAKRKALDYIFSEFCDSDLTLNEFVKKYSINKVMRHSLHNKILIETELAPAVEISRSVFVDEKNRDKLGIGNRLEYQQKVEEFQKGYQLRKSMPKKYDDMLYINDFYRA